MKAAILHEFKAPLRLEDVPRPALGPEDVLIRVEACGVCHSDLHVADGDWVQLKPITKLPLILGHEIAGSVAEMGAGVTELRTGDRVGVPWLYWSCGACEFCKEGNENLCVQQKITGVTVDGGYAQFVKARASHAVKIPENVSFNEAAPLCCAGVTVYRALKQAKMFPGQRVAVFGVGGLGHLAVQLARAAGAEVIAIDVGEEKLRLAAALGAAKTLNAAATDVVKELRGKGGVHVAVVTSAARAAYDMAFYSLRPRGTLLVVGLPADNICFPPILMAAGEVNIQASAVGTRQDLRDVLTLAAAGKVRCQVAARPLSEANAVMQELHAGKVSGRVVLTPQ
jgi:alcohol dehydrogenase, propanol-preferring